METLKETWPLEHIEPFGEVLAIPNKAFKNEWRGQLEAEGVKIFAQSLHGEAYLFLKAYKQETKQPETEKDFTIEQIPLLGRGWTREEEEKLKELNEQGLKSFEIAEKLGRTPSSIRAHYAQMKERSQASETETIRVRRKKWTSQDDAHLKDLYSQDLPVVDIASKLGRSKTAIHHRLKKLGISTLTVEQDKEDQTQPSVNVNVNVNDDFVKEVLSACSLLYPSHKQACALLLKEASNKILGEA